MELRKNGYYLGGMKVKDLVDKYESPLYIYDLATIKKQYNRITSAFNGSRVRIN
ncbi:MAG: diaminopimelate decarboxylase, partial [Bacteroidales bacterium]|nr:diaminopimelate decarboxylase [Bacteroidales bacterium]